MRGQYLCLTIQYYNRNKKIVPFYLNYFLKTSTVYFLKYFLSLFLNIMLKSQIAVELFKLLSNTALKNL